MDSKNLESLLVKISHSNEENDRTTAFCTITNVQNPKFLQKALESLAQLAPENYNRRILDTAIDGLTDTVTESLPVLINYALSYPNTPVGKDCIYVLGEISYKQCSRKLSDYPDVRILPALLDILNGSTEISPDTFDACLGAIGQHQYYGDMQAAKPTLEKALDSLRTSSSEPSYAYETISYLIELLALINSSTKIIMLQDQLDQCLPESWLARNIQAEIADKN